MKSPLSQLPHGYNSSLPRGGKIAVVTFGRFNPPTKGHELLFRIVHETAKSLGGDALIFPSRLDGEKLDRLNPLPFAVKMQFIKALMPWANVIDDASVISPWSMPQYLAEHGYTSVYLVAGSDREDEYSHRLVEHMIKFVSEAKVISAGSRDPNADGVAGMSASKARFYARANDFEGFKASSGWEGEIAMKLMESVIKHMKEIENGTNKRIQGKTS